MGRPYPVMNLGVKLLAQAQTLTSDQASNWVAKIQSSMADVATIQSWVSGHAQQAASVGLDKDAANLPPTGSIQDYPQLASIMADLQAARPVDMTQLSCIDQLIAATQAAKAKIAAFPASFADFIQSPTGIGIAAGAGAVGVGLLKLL